MKKNGFRLLCCLLTIMVLTAVFAMTTQAAFDMENFKGLVLQNTASSVSVTLYTGFSESSSKKMTPVYTETVDGVTSYYYEVTAGSKYTCIAKPSSGYARYNDAYHIYISAEEATQKSVMDVTPQVRSTSGWDPSGQIRHYTDETLTNIYPSDPALWPQYADVYTTPAFTKDTTLHEQTTQTEMMDFINGRDDSKDNMYVYILGQSNGSKDSEKFDIPLVIFTTVDLSGAKTLEDAAALLRADSQKNNKLTIHYQAQIHGNEPAAGEAALAMIKRLDGAYGEGLLDSMNIYVIPRLSPYGAYKSQRQVYLSSGSTDPNRDFLRLNTTEVQLRMKAFNLLDPEVVFDGHEFQVALTSVRLQKRDMMMCTHYLPNSTAEFRTTALELANAAFGQLKKDGLSYTWYSDSVGGIGGNTGSSNTAFRGVFHILMETDGIYRGLQNYERRVTSHISAMTGMFAYLDENAAAVKAAARNQQQLIVENGKTYKEEDIVVLDGTSSDNEELHIIGQWINTDSGTIYSNNSSFEAVEPNGIKRSRPAPTAYVLPADHAKIQKILTLMDRQGIAYDFVPAGSGIQLQQYTVISARADGTTSEAGLTDEHGVYFAQGAYVFPMDQPDALILAILMEPDGNDTYNSDLEKYMGTLAHDKVITATNGKFPIYRYIHDLKADGTIDYAPMSAAPQGLTAVNAEMEATCGKITGLDAAKSYEYRAEGETTYTAIPAGATEISVLPGTYYVRFTGSADAVITVYYDRALENTVYLDDTNGNDTNDGYSELGAVKTIDKAYEQLDALMATLPQGITGKLIIVGTYEVAGSRKLPTHTYPLLITGDTLKLVPTSDDSYPYLGIGGDTTFQDIALVTGNSTSSFLCGEGNKLVIGENVTSGTSNYFNITGGGHYRTSETIGSTDVTIKSGYWGTLYAGGYTIKTNGNARLVAENCSVSRVTNSYNASTTGDVYYSLKNVTVRTELYCGNTSSANIGGNVTLVLGEGVTSPKIYAGSRTKGNVEGTVTVILDGIDLTTNVINGKANNDTGTIGGLALVLNQGQLANVASSFLTRDGVAVTLGCDQTEAATIPYSIDLDLKGHNAANITVADGKTMTVKDTGTTLGVLSATGTVVPAEGYKEKVVSGGKSYPEDLPYLPGDMDGNSEKNTEDAVYLLLHVLFGENQYPIDSAADRDLNNDNKVDTEDAVYLLLNVLFGENQYPI